jgi:hypothetical protein
MVAASTASGLRYSPVHSFSGARATFHAPAYPEIEYSLGTGSYRLINKPRYSDGVMFVLIINNKFVLMKNETDNMYGVITAKITNIVPTPEKALEVYLNTVKQLKSKDGLDYPIVDKFIYLKTLHKTQIFYEIIETTDPELSHLKYVAPEKIAEDPMITPWVKDFLHKVWNELQRMKSLGKLSGTPVSTGTATAVVLPSPGIAIAPRIGVGAVGLGVPAVAGLGVSTAVVGAPALAGLGMSAVAGLGMPAVAVGAPAMVGVSSAPSVLGVPPIVSVARVVPSPFLRLFKSR